VESIDQMVNDGRAIQYLSRLDGSPLIAVGSPVIVDRGKSHERGEVEVKAVVTEIVPYHESGGLGPVPWFAIIAGDRIIARLNSTQVFGVGYVPLAEEEL